MSPHVDRNPGRPAAIVSPRRTKVAWWTAVAALAAVSWCLAGWFMTDSIVLDCVGGADRTVTCTVTRHYWLRTGRTDVVGVSGVRVLTDTGGESTTYQLRLSTASGPSGPNLTDLYSDRRSAAREANRLAELVAVAPGSSVSEPTQGPSPLVEDLIIVLLVMVAVVFVGAVIGMILVILIFASEEFLGRWS